MDELSSSGPCRQSEPVVVAASLFCTYFTCESSVNPAPLHALHFLYSSGLRQPKGQPSRIITSTLSAPAMFDRYFQARVDTSKKEFLTKKSCSGLFWVRESRLLTKRNLEFRASWTRMLGPTQQRQHRNSRFEAQRFDVGHPHGVHNVLGHQPLSAVVVPNIGIELHSTAIRRSISRTIQGPERRCFCSVSVCLYVCCPNRLSVQQSSQSKFSCAEHASRSRSRALQENTVCEKYVMPSGYQDNN